MVPVRQRTHRCYLAGFNVCDKHLVGGRIYEPRFDEYDPLSLLHRKRRIQAHDEAGLRRMVGLREMRASIIAIQAIVRMHVPQMHRHAADQPCPFAQTDG